MQVVKLQKSISLYLLQGEGVVPSKKEMRWRAVIGMHNIFLEVTDLFEFYR
jgi:hypothetical protein